MNQQGFIIEIVDDKTAKLKMQRHSACAHCGKCITSSETKDIVVEVDNSIGAKAGDRVEVNMDGVRVMKATAIAYMIPLVALLAGTIVAYFGLQAIGLNSGIEIISGIVGLVSTGVAFLIIRKNDKKFRDSGEYIPKVTRILVM